MAAKTREQRADERARRRQSAPPREPEAVDVGSDAGEEQGARGREDALREAAAAAVAAAAVSAARAIARSRRAQPAGAEDAAAADPEPESEPESEPEDGAISAEPEAAGGGERGEVEQADETAARPEPAPIRDPGGLVGRAKQYLAVLLGAEPDSVSGLRRSEGGWTVCLEVVEVHRIPESTDVLASYEVELDGEGSLLSFERTRRYYRSEADRG